MSERFELSVGEGVIIRGQVVKPLEKEEKYPTIIICHGIPQSKQTPHERNKGYEEVASFFAGHGFLSVIFNFRGTGESSGNFDLWGWQKDLNAVLDYILKHPEVKKEEVVLLGFSGGAATSCITAAKRKEIAKVFLLACPADFDFLFKNETPEFLINQARDIGIIRDVDFPRDDKKWYAEQVSFRPADYISLIAPRPLWLIHGVKDDLVLPSHADRLYEAAREPKKLIFIEGAPHQLRGYPGILELCVKEAKI